MESEKSSVLWLFNALSSWNASPCSELAEFACQATGKSQWVLVDRICGNNAWRGIAKLLCSLLPLSSSYSNSGSWHHLFRTLDKSRGP